MAAAGSPMSGIRPKPLLASDALKEDVAPLQPAEVGARRLAAGMAALMASIAASLQLGLAGKAPALAALSAGAAAIPLALLALRVPYRTRAYALLGLGLALLVESLAGRGPGFAVLSDPGTGLPWEIARALTATVLPAALLFRASYRAYPVARTLLAWALVLSLPFVVRSGYVVLFEHEMAARVAAGATIASILLALLGFMGSGTTAMGSAWATCLLGILAGEIALRQVFGVADGSLRHVIAAASFLAGSTLGAVGLFQSVSVAKAGEARCIDVRRNTEEPPEASRPSGEY